MDKRNVDSGLCANVRGTGPGRLAPRPRASVEVHAAVRPPSCLSWKCKRACPRLVAVEWTWVEFRMLWLPVEQRLGSGGCCSSKSPLAVAGCITE